MKPRRFTAAFTMVELLVTASISVVLSGIIYAVASEGVTSFARNISINRSYSDARLALERIAQTVQSAGHTPVLIDANGARTSASPAAGIRFYRANGTPTYKITSGSTGIASSNNTVTVTVGTGQFPPAADDVIVISTQGFQGTVRSVATSGTSATLTFTGTLTAACSPAPTGPIDFTSPQQYCQVYTQVQFIVVGTQLRYYPLAYNVVDDTAAVFNDKKNYKVIANVVASANATTGVAATPLLPFSLPSPPTVTIRLYAETPDYNNRKLGSSSTYTFMQTSLGPRCPLTVREPY